MSNTDITRLVVGESFKKALGSPVTQQGAASDMPEGSTLRWVDGRWEQKAKSLEDLVRRYKLPSASSIRLRAGRPGWLKLPKGPVARFVVEVAIAFIIGLPIAIYFSRPSVTSEEQKVAKPPAVAPELPLEPRPTVDNGIIREVDSPYIAPVADIPIGGPQANRVAPTPVQQGPVVRAAPTARVVVPPIPAEAPATAAPSAPSPQPTQAAPDQKKAQGSGAVVLDEDDKREASPAKPTAQLPPAIDPSKAVAREPVRTGLVAITPDGKTALFTDPKTRLPAQFKVGDKLANGETIKTIDSKAGKVITDIKTYALE